MSLRVSLLSLTRYFSHTKERQSTAQSQQILTVPMVVRRRHQSQVRVESSPYVLRVSDSKLDEGSAPKANIIGQEGAVQGSVASSECYSLPTPGKTLNTTQTQVLQHHKHPHQILLFSTFSRTPNTLFYVHYFRISTNTT